MEHFGTLCKARCLSLKIRLFTIRNVFRNVFCRGFGERYFYVNRSHSIGDHSTSVDEINVRSDWQMLEKRHKRLERLMWMET